MFLVLIGLAYIDKLMLASPPLTSQPLLLTEYIDTKNITTARNLSLVRGGYCNISKSYSGYITVDRELKKHLFFWLFPSRLNKKTSPLVIWLNGGPARSSLLGLLLENGPLEIVHKNGSVDCKRRKISWSDDMSMLYIDGPVGTGFSYAETKIGRSKVSTSDYGKDLYNFLHQFRRLFSEFKRRDLYIGGEGYAAKFVISFAHRLLQSSRKTANSKLLFSGIYLSGPFFSPEIQLRSALDLMFSIGTRSYKEMMDQRFLIKQFFNRYRNNKLLNNSATLDHLMYIIQKRQPADNYVLKKFIKFPIIDKLINEKLKRHLHVRADNFTCCDHTRDINFLRDFVFSMKDQLADIMNVSKVLIFSGEFDALISPAMVDYGLMSTQWCHQQTFNSSIRHKWKLHSALKGYFTRVDQFCRVVIAGAGHMTAMDEPKSTLEMMKQFIKSGCVS